MRKSASRIGGERDTLLHFGNGFLMLSLIRAASILHYKAAWPTDNRKMDHALTAMAKWFSGQVPVKYADEALQMHGGYGYIDEYKVQRIYRDGKILEIYEGAKEIEKSIVAKTLLRL
jgi:alkylation response protein AidB-like acyl-CoA dehydrogenase